MKTWNSTIDWPREGFGVEGRSCTRKRLRMGLFRQAFCSRALREFMLSSCWHHDWDRFTWTKREDRTAQHQQRGAERCKFSPLHVAQIHTDRRWHGTVLWGCQCCQHAALTVQDLLCSFKCKRFFSFLFQAIISTYGPHAGNTFNQTLQNWMKRCWSSKLFVWITGSSSVSSLFIVSIKGKLVYIMILCNLI